MGLINGIRGGPRYCQMDRQDKYPKPEYVADKGVGPGCNGEKNFINTWGRSSFHGNAWWRPLS